MKTQRAEKAKTNATGEQPELRDKDYSPPAVRELGSTAELTRGGMMAPIADPFGS